MSLHVTTIGQGPWLVLLHGWALNSHVWDDVVPRLASEFTVVCVDLPGHGASEWQPRINDLDSLAESVLPHLGAQFEPARLEADLLSGGGRKCFARNARRRPEGDAAGVTAERPVGDQRARVGKSKLLRG